MDALFILILILAFNVISCLPAEDQRGIVHVYGSSRIRVQLECGAKFMNVHLFINGTAPFFDWIVVGKTNRPECRQQGNGDLQYLIEIPLINDPCGTKMMEASSTFENVISIKRMPLLILEGDETVSVQCVYGPPEIGTQIIPTLPPSQNVQQSFLTTPKTDQPPDESQNVVDSTKPAGILPAHIYLIIFMALFLTLLCLCCGCMYFFFKRRKLRVERRKKLLLAVPPNSELSKLGLRHLWWSGKHGGTISGTVSNDALLSHDYMVSSHSTTRGHLSVSTDYPGSTPPSSGGSSSNASAGTTNGLVAERSNTPGENRDHGNMQMYVHDDRRMLSRAHMEPMVNTTGRTAASVMVAANVVVNSLRCIPEERGDHLRSDGSSIGTARSRASVKSPSNKKPLYASVEKKHKLYQSDSPDASTHGSPTGIQSPSVPERGTMINHARSVSEIYSVPSNEGDHDENADAASISTLEGKRYSPTQEQIRQATIVRADVHHIGPPPNVAPPPPPQVSSPPTTSPPPVPNDDHGHQKLEPIGWEIYVQAVENDRSQILSDRDVERWRRLMTDDLEIRRLVVDCKTLEDFEAISHSPKYGREFAQEKWAVIVQNLAQVAFMRRLSNIIDTQHEQQQSHQKPYAVTQMANSGKGQTQQQLSVKPLDPTQLATNHDMAETLRNLQQGRQKRLFTRESYYQVKQGIKPVPMDPDQPFVVSEDGMVSSGSATMLSQQFRDRSNSECFEIPPMLTVYLGDVASERNLYSENFMNGIENTYSTASHIGASNGKAYQYESNGTKTDEDDHQYQIGAESNAIDGNMYAPPSSSTIYAPESVGNWKQQF